MITNFHQPALNFKVQWIEWHPMGWCLEWTGYTTLEEAEAAEANIKYQESLNGNGTRQINPGDDVEALIVMLNKNHR